MSIVLLLLFLEQFVVLMYDGFSYFVFTAILN